MNEPILQTDIPGLHRHAAGKVRDIYLLSDAILLVATDRISAFDVVMPNGILHKGRVLTQLSKYWFQRLRPLAATHLISTEDEYVLQRLQEEGAVITEETARRLAGRCTLGVRAEALPVECVVRGWLAGSLWQEYLHEDGPKHGAILHGVPLPAGLRECDRLPEPIFTPATKAASGHDENIGRAEVEALTGRETAQALEETSLALYNEAARHAERAGLILADTKFEFGMHRGALTLIDEALTPDSSRYWEASMYEPGKSQPSYDKQFVRDWLLASGWNREPPGPLLPPEVAERTSQKYCEAYQRLCGRALPE